MWLIYIVSQKMSHFVICCNFNEYRPIFTILSPVPLASTPPGHIPTNILVRGTSMGISPNIITYFKFSTSEFTKTYHLEITKPKNFLGGAVPLSDLIPFGASSPQPWTRVDAIDRHILHSVEIGKFAITWLLNTTAASASRPSVCLSVRPSTRL